MALSGAAISWLPTRTPSRRATQRRRLCRRHWPDSPPLPLGTHHSARARDEEALAAGADWSSRTTCLASAERESAACVPGRSGFGGDDAVLVSRCLDEPDRPLARRAGSSCKHVLPCPADVPLQVGDASRSADETVVTVAVLLNQGIDVDGSIMAASNYGVFMFSLSLLVLLVPSSWVFGRLLQRRDLRWPSGFRWVVRGALAPYVAVVVAAGTFSPFLYFQF